MFEHFFSSKLRLKWGLRRQKSNVYTCHKSVFVTRTPPRQGVVKITTEKPQQKQPPSLCGAGMQHTRMMMMDASTGQRRRRRRRRRRRQQEQEQEQERRQLAQSRRYDAGRALPPHASASALRPRGRPCRKPRLRTMLGNALALLAQEHGTALRNMSAAEARRAQQTSRMVQ